VALDRSSSNLYIADGGNDRVRKVNLSSGVITTIAGTSTQGGQGAYSGDGGPATSAQFNRPAGVELDAAGNIYIADSRNHRIRRIEASSGIITTIVGAGSNGDGCASETAGLKFPLDLAVNAAGSNLYIADYQDNRIRMMNVVDLSPLPKLTDISPSSGEDGKTYQITLTGTGMVTSGGGAGCASGTSTVQISGSGVSISNISISSGSATMTFTIAVGAPPGARDVTVTNSRGTSNPVKFNVGLATPTITSISPNKGVRGTTITVTITGTNFVQGPGETTVRISSGGVIVGGPTVQSATSLTVNFAIMPDAAIGNYLVDMTTKRGGDSNAVQFSVVSSTPSITSISPSSGVRGTTVQVTINGSSFTAGAGTPTLNISGSGITGSNVSVVSDSSLTATFTIAPTAALGEYLVTVTLSGGGTSNPSSFSVNPSGPTFTYGMPQQLNPTQQVPLQLGLASASSDTVNGTLTVTFNPGPAGITDDANVTLVGSQGSARTINFTFSANTTTPVLSFGNPMLQAGTVAGTIRLTLSNVTVGGQAVTPTNGTYDITIPRMAPVITNVRILNRTSAGFEVEVTGYSTTREVTQSTFQFTAASGANLVTTQLQPDIASTFAAYYQTPDSQSVGSAFVYTQPFIVKQGDASAVGSITVTLTNKEGTSDPKTIS
jgi:hypothetical protein